MLSVLYPLLLSLSFSLLRVAFIELPLRFMICKCSTAAAQFCVYLLLFNDFSQNVANPTPANALNTLHTHTHTQRHRHSHACLMSVCGRWSLSSSVLKVAIVESRMRTCPSTTFSLMSIAFYVQDMTALHKMFASCARVLFDIIKMGQTNWGETPYL